MLHTHNPRTRVLSPPYVAEGGLKKTPTVPTQRRHWVPSRGRPVTGVGSWTQDDRRGDGPDWVTTLDPVRRGGAWSEPWTLLRTSARVARGLYKGLCLHEPPREGLGRGLGGRRRRRGVSSGRGEAHLDCQWRFVPCRGVTCPADQCGHLSFRGVQRLVLTSAT